MNMKQYANVSLHIDYQNVMLTILCATNHKKDNPEIH